MEHIPTLRTRKREAVRPPRRRGRDRALIGTEDLGFSEGMAGVGRSGEPADAVVSSDEREAFADLLVHRITQYVTAIHVNAYASLEMLEAAEGRDAVREALREIMEGALRTNEDVSRLRALVPWDEDVTVRLGPTDSPIGSAGMRKG